jgi:rhodanese-related sulfurtransferase
MVEEITVKETAELLKNGGIKLLDVRTPEEYSIAKIAGATLVSDDNAAEILAWPKETPIVVHCHHGGRSMNAAAFLQEKGFTNVRNMAGGIDAWSVDVDASIPRY